MLMKAWRRAEAYDFPRREPPLADALRVARFVRGAMLHRARRDDVYISSYPRSGTTWMQLLVHLVRGGDLAFEHIAHVVPWYERQLALGRATAADFARLASPRAFKSHLPYAYLPKGARYVYVYRDGRDVLISYYHFYCSHLGYTGDFDAFFERFMAGDLQYGSWFRHVAHWKQNAPLEHVLFLQYEDVQRDPERAVRRIADLCRVDLAPARLRDILDAGSFDAMRKAERKYDHATSERPDDPSAARGTFVRAGQVGGYQGHLSAAQHARFERALSGRASALPALNLAAFLQ